MLAEYDQHLLRVAFHEAGHAWMMLREGLGVRSVTVAAGSAAPGDTRGMTVPDSPLEEGNPELSRKCARAALAGSLAEHFLMGQWDEEVLQARAYDTGKARSALTISGEEWMPDSMDYTIHSMSNAVLNEISQLKAWDEITVIAYALMERSTLSGEELAALIGNA